MNPKIQVSEAQVKKAVNDYLTLQQKMGHLLFFRLQCGSFLVNYGDHKQKIQLCDAGTADYVVIQGRTSEVWMPEENHYEPAPYAVVTFLEIKSSTGRQSPDQVAFEKMAQAQNCRYFIIRDASQLEELL